MVCAFCKGPVYQPVTDPRIPDATLCSVQCLEFAWGITTFDGSTCPKCQDKLAHVGRMYKHDAEYFGQVMARLGLESVRVTRGNVWCCPRCEWFVLKATTRCCRHYLIFDDGNELTIYELRKVT